MITKSRDLLNIKGVDFNFTDPQLHPLKKRFVNFLIWYT